MSYLQNFPDNRNQLTTENSRHWLAYAYIPNLSINTCLSWQTSDKLKTPASINTNKHFFQKSTAAHLAAKIKHVFMNSERPLAHLKSILILSYTLQSILTDLSTSDFPSTALHKLFFVLMHATCPALTTPWQYVTRNTSTPTWPALSKCVRHLKNIFFGTLFSNAPPPPPP